MDENEYVCLKRQVRRLLSINLDDYKEHQMRRRLDGLVARQKETSVASYCRALEVNKDLLRSLQGFLTINVSQFFRDEEPFEILRTHVLPELLGHSPRMKIWSAGCSNGPEPYSVAMILDIQRPFQTHRILATDIDETSLAQARAGGPFTQSDMKNVSERCLRRYFVRRGNEYWAADRLMQMVEFKAHNLLRDPFESDFDLVICRNVVIYLSNDARSKLLRGFHGALKENGVLFVGGTENMLGGFGGEFERLYPSFYRKSGVVDSGGHVGSTAAVLGGREAKSRIVSPTARR